MKSKINIAKKVTANLLLAFIIIVSNILNLEAQSPAFQSLGDATGLPINNQLIQEAATRLRNTFPDSFRNQFAVFDVGFYTEMQEYSTYSFEEAFNLCKSESTTLSPYYLLIGRVNNTNQLNKEYFLDLKIPTTGNFSCITDEERSELTNVVKDIIDLEFQKKGTYQSEELILSIIEGTQKKIDDIINCCIRGSNSCSSYRLKDKVWYTPDWEPFIINEDLKFDEVGVSNNYPKGTIPIIISNYKYYIYDSSKKAYVNQADNSTYNIIHPNLSFISDVYLYVCNEEDCRIQIFVTDYNYANFKKVNIEYSNSQLVEFVTSFSCKQVCTEENINILTNYLANNITYLDLAAAEDHGKIIYSSDKLIVKEYIHPGKFSLKYYNGYSKYNLFYLSSLDANLISKNINNFWVYYDPNTLGEYDQFLYSNISIKDIARKLEPLCYSLNISLNRGISAGAAFSDVSQEAVFWSSIVLGGAFYAEGLGLLGGQQADKCAVAAVIDIQLQMAINAIIKKFKKENYSAKDLFNEVQWASVGAACATSKFDNLDLATNFFVNAGSGFYDDLHRQLKEKKRLKELNIAESTLNGLIQGLIGVAAGKISGWALNKFKGKYSNSEITNAIEDFEAHPEKYVNGLGKWLSKEQMRLLTNEWASLYRQSLTSNTQLSKFNKACTARWKNATKSSDEVFYGRNGGILNTKSNFPTISAENGLGIHPTLQSKLPSNTKWPNVANCAECDAVNQALWKGAKWDEIQIHTIDIRPNGTMTDIIQCSECLNIFSGMRVTSQ